MTVAANTEIVADTSAFAFYQAGQYDQAQTICRQILHHNPDDYNELQLLSVIALNDGDCSMASDLISRAVTIIDFDPSAYIYCVSDKSSRSRNQRRYFCHPFGRCDG